MNPQEFGRASEDWAFQYLLSLGWVVLDRNVTMRCGELDIVAMDGDELVVVEVRARHIGQVLPPEATVGPKKMRKLIKTGRHYVEKRESDGHWRVDLIAITTRGDQQEVEHFRDITYAYLSG